MMLPWGMFHEIHEMLLVCLFSLCLACPLILLKVVFEGMWGSSKSQQVAEKSFRCDYEGCGRLYTTAHHLKVHKHTLHHLKVHTHTTPPYTT